MPELKDKNVFLIGFMGVGKSVVAPRLAEKMGVPLIDMGPLIRQKLGYRSSSQIFADLGEKAYRDAETEILKEKLKLKGQVFSCGGGITVREENVKMMKGKGTVVWMTATPETILEHLEGDDSRPLLRGSVWGEDDEFGREAALSRHENSTSLINSSDKASASWYSVW